MTHFTHGVAVFRRKPTTGRHARPAKSSRRLQQCVSQLYLLPSASWLRSRGFRHKRVLLLANVVAHAALLAASQCTNTHSSGSMQNEPCKFRWVGLTNRGESDDRPGQLASC